MASKLVPAPAVATVASLAEGFRAPVVSHKALTSAAAQVLIKSSRAYLLNKLQKREGSPSHCTLCPLLR